MEEALRSGGDRPLDPDVRRQAEGRLGHDFSRVRIHADAGATTAAADLHARALTLGQHIAFGTGQYQPWTTAGLRLLDHELVHTTQQSRFGDGQLSGAPVLPADHPSEQQADHRAAEAVPLSAPAVQRQVAGSGAQQSRHPPEFENPSRSPRYIDTVFQQVSYDILTGLFTFSWSEGAREKRVRVHVSDLVQDPTRRLVPILEVFATRAEAVAETEAYNREVPKSSSAYFFAFYRGPEDVILPTAFAAYSTPEFHHLLPALRRKAAKQAGKIAAALKPFADFLNPVPFTEVDERGKLRASSNPWDLLALLRLRRLKIAKGGPRTSRRHSGAGVRYRVYGPHDKLKGTSVYVLKDAQGNVLYVGKGGPLERLREHIKDPKKTTWFGEIAEVEVRGTALTNTEALALEESLIGQLGPLHNVDRNPFRKEFGTAMEVGPNLPKSQETLRFRVSFTD